MKTFGTTILVAGIVWAIFGADRAVGEEITASLSDGSKITMTEPVDVAGATWEKSKDVLPRLFFKVDVGLAGEQEKLAQLLSTARSVGLLYLNRSEKVTGGGDDFDMFKFEQAREDALKGKMGLKAREAIEEADAVGIWWAMLEDKAKEANIKPPAPVTPNSSSAFMDAYAEMIERGDDSDIYSETIMRIAKIDPASFSSYLSKTTPERRRLLEVLGKSPTQ